MSCQISVFYDSGRCLYQHSNIAEFFIGIDVPCPRVSFLEEISLTLPVLSSFNYHRGTIHAISFQPGTTSLVCSLHFGHVLLCQSAKLICAYEKEFMLVAGRSSCHSISWQTHLFARNEKCDSIVCVVISVNYLYYNKYAPIETGPFSPAHVISFNIYICNWISKQQWVQIRSHYEKWARSSLAWTTVLFLCLRFSEIEVSYFGSYERSAQKSSCSLSKMIWNT